MAKLFQPQEFELSNGIPVILLHYEGPVAATYWWVKTGSADEAPPEAGFAHFLEHMLFKDAAAKETGRASTGQIARTIESLGGDINAYTSFDQTVYHVTCAAQHWEKVLDAFGTMAKPQKFLVSDFEREREVILEELRKNEDSPGRQAFQTLFSTTFSKHPYGRPVIGYVKTLKAAKAPKLEEFYKRNYVSGKMGLILVGPIEDEKGFRKKSIIRYLEKHFGQKVLRKKEGVSRSRPTEKDLREQPEWVVKPFDVKTPSLFCSFRVPELNHEDIPALDLLSGILGMGELSRLYQRLFYKTSIATEVSAGLYVPKDPGMLFFQAEMDSIDKVNSAAEELFREMRRIVEEGPSTEELSRVLVNAESERLYATQTADGMASRLGFLKFIMGDLKFDEQYLNDLRAVDSARIQEVARKYLDYHRMSGVLLVPKSEAKYDVSEIRNKCIRILDTGPAAEPSISWKSKSAPLLKKPELAGPEYIQLPSGMLVSYYPRPGSHVFSIHASAMGGTRLEIGNPLERSETDWGASYLMSLAWTKGTSKLNASQISAITEGRAASIDGFSGRNSIGLQLTGLARDWGVLSDLFSHVLLEPIFPESEVEHSKRIAEDSVRSVEDHSGQLCTKLFLETLFEKHPYGKMTHGSLESIAALSSGKLRAFHQAWIRPERLVISVSGAVPRQALLEFAHRLEDQAVAIAKQANAFNLSEALKNEPDLIAPRWIERPMGREQFHILLVGLGTHVNSPDRFVLRILQTLLGGQSGRLFIELREKKSLAYTVSPISFEGVERGYTGTYIACAPQKKEEAASGIRSVLETLVNKGPSEKEMKRAKEFFLGRRAMELQSDTSLAAHYGLESLYKQGHLKDHEILQKVNAITAKEIQEICRKYLVEPHMVMSVVG